MTRNTHTAWLLMTVALAGLPIACQKDAAAGKAVLMRYAHDMNPGDTVTAKDVLPIELDEDAVPGLGDPVPFEHINSLTAKPLCEPVTKNQWVLQKHFVKDDSSVDAQLEKYLPSRPASRAGTTSRP